MKFLEKLQKQPEYIRKTILWAIVVIVGLMLIFLWFYSVKKNVQKFQSGKIIEGLNLPDFEKETKDLPKIKEEFKNVEDLLKELEKATITPEPEKASESKENIINQSED